jgi:uncharacterized UPF0160 family protein
MSTVTFGTHAGKNRPSNVVGFALLSILHSNVIPVLSNLKNKTDKCDVVCDVGEWCNPEKDRFNHLAIETFDKKYTFSNKYDIMCCSAGLIYKKYGIKIIKKINGNIQYVDEIYNDLYVNFILGIDLYERKKQFKSSYKLFDVIDIISIYNDPTRPVQIFREIGNIIKKVIIRYIKNRYLFYKIFNKEYKIVSKAYGQRSDIHYSAKILLLPGKCNYLKQCIKKYEREYLISEGPDIVIYYNDNGKWILHTLDQLNYPIDFDKLYDNMTKDKEKYYDKLSETSICSFYKMKLLRLAVSMIST